MTLVRRLALLVALEGVALLAVGIGYGISGLGSHEQLPIELAALSALLAGLLLVFLARAASEVKGWSRSPIVVLNVFPFPLALTQLQAGVWWVALPMVLVAGSVLYLLATPELRAAFTEPA